MAMICSLLNPFHCIRRSRKDIMSQGMPPKMPCPTRQRKAGILAILRTICPKLIFPSPLSLPLAIPSLLSSPLFLMRSFSLARTDMATESIPTNTYGFCQSSNQIMALDAAVPAAFSARPMNPKARPLMSVGTNSTSIVCVNGRIEANAAPFADRNTACSTTDDPAAAMPNVASPHARQDALRTSWARLIVWRWTSHPQKGNARA
mmetsp:Transcript_63116/g.186491  ORF Transcript_63116/g.186491 Transcript_63116/m.186491 type:complete len:205 (+) Transcript_63116:1661-2275(+)